MSCNHSQTTLTQQQSHNVQSGLGNFMVSLTPYLTPYHTKKGCLNLTHVMIGKYELCGPPLYITNFGDPTSK